MRLSLITLFLLTSFNLTWADVGSCALYKCTVDLGNNDLLTGYFQIATKDELPSTDQEFLEYIKLRDTGKDSDTVKFYSKIQTIDYPKYEWSNKVKYSAAAIEDIRLINVKQIQSMTILKMTSCECVKTKDGTFEYSKTDFLIHYYHPLIDEITQKEIDLLNSQKPIFKYYVQVNKTDVDAILVLNYNSKLDEISFKKLSDKLKFEKKESQTWQKYDQSRKEHYLKIRDSLRKQGIIVIRLISYS